MITTPQHCFVQFDTQIIDCDCDFLLPLASLSELMFYLQGHAIELQIVDRSGDNVIFSQAIDSADDWVNFPIDLSLYLAVGDCFRLGLKEDAGGIYYSNLFIYDANPKYCPLVQYWSYSKTNFPYTDDQTKLNSLRLPIWIAFPQPVNENESYTDANGKINFPYISMRQKYAGTSDYLNADAHKKVQAALMHDLLTFNGIAVTITGDYKIDWDNRDWDNETAVSTFEVQEQEVIFQRII